MKTNQPTMGAPTETPKRKMRGPRDAHPDSQHYGEHVENVYCCQGPAHIQCVPIPEPQQHVSSDLTHKEDISFREGK